MIRWQIIKLMIKQMWLTEFDKILFTFVSIIGAIVFTVNASDNCSFFTKFNLVNLLAIPALLKSTFKPSSPTIESTSFAKLL